LLERRAPAGFLPIAEAPNLGTRSAASPAAGRPGQRPGRHPLDDPAPKKRHARALGFSAPGISAPVSRRRARDSSKNHGTLMAAFFANSEQSAHAIFAPRPAYSPPTFELSSKDQYKAIPASSTRGSPFFLSGRQAPGENKSQHSELAQKTLGAGIPTSPAAEWAPYGPKCSRRKA